MAERRCFCCDKIVEVEEDKNPMILGTASSALWFTATGNYGSRIFDPINSDESLRILICDHCIRSKIVKVDHIVNIQHNITGEKRKFRL